MKGQPVTLDLVRGMMGTPRVEQLSEAPPAAVFEFLRYMIDPRKADGKRLSFTVAVERDQHLWRIVLRNSVMAALAANPSIEHHA